MEQLGENFVINTKGLCLAPYIKDDDHLLVEKIRSWKALKTGDLILVKKEGEEEQFFVHRVLFSQKTKGDRLLQFDQEDSDSLHIQGKVMARLNLSSKDLSIVYLSSSLHRFLHWMQACLSLFNHQKFPGLRKGAVAALICLGKTARRMENLFFQRKHK